MNLDSIIHSAMADLQVPGFSLAIVKDDRVIAARGYGQGIDEHTTFAIASISKSFTATALAMLVDEGRLGWDDPVSRHLPGFQLYDSFASREMRVRDLLIHNSGLHEVSGGTIWYGSDLSREEVIYRLRYLKPSFSFRSQYAYQNVMYLAAGHIVLAVTGQNWDTFIQQRIFDPLGMKDSAPNYARARSNPNMAVPYARLPYGGSSRVPVQIPYRDHDNCGPAASIHASAWDLAQYLRLHLNQGSFAGQALIQPRTAAELHTAQIVASNGVPPAALARLQPRFLNYALGWRVFDYAGRKLVQHSGGVDGMRTLVTMLPEEGVGVVALSNQEVGMTYAVTYAALDELLGRETFDYTAAYRQAFDEQIQAQQAAELQRAARRITGTQPALPLEGYTGRYLSPLIDFVEVNLSGGSLSLRFARTPAFTAGLEHWHYNTFRLNWHDPYIPWGLVTFQLGADGRVDSLIFNQPNLLDVDFRELGRLQKSKAA